MMLIFLFRKFIENQRICFWWMGVTTPIHHGSIWGRDSKHLKYGASPSPYVIFPSEWDLWDPSFRIRMPRPLQELCFLLPTSKLIYTPITWWSSLHDHPQKKLSWLKYSEEFPSREATYSTLGKGKITFKHTLGKGYASSQEGTEYTLRLELLRLAHMRFLIINSTSSIFTIFSGIIIIIIILIIILVVVVIILIHKWSLQFIYEEDQQNRSRDSASVKGKFSRSCPKAMARSICVGMMSHTWVCCFCFERLKHVTWRKRWC